MDLIALALIIVSLFFTVGIYALRIPQRIKYPRNIPRVPFTISGGPFLSHTSGPYDYEEQLVKKYPKLVLKVHGVDPQIIITDPRLFKKVGALDFRSFGNSLQDLNKAINGLFGANGQTWQDQRNLFNPAFNMSSTATYNQTIIECTNEHLQVLQDVVTSGEMLDLFAFTKSLTLQIICKIAFGVPLSLDNKQDKQDLDSLAQITEQSFYSTKDKSMVFKAISLFPPLKYLLALVVKYSPQFKRFMMAMGAPGRRMLDIYKDREMKKPQQQQNSVDSNKLSEEKDVEDSSFKYNTAKGSSLQNFPDWQNYRGPGLFMELLQRGQIEGKNITLPQTLGNLTTFLVAGHETTATTLTFALYHIAKNPEIQNKVIEEVDQFGRNKEFGDDDFNEFPYIKAIINETLRIYSPVITVFRRNFRDIQLDEFKIPKNTSLILPIRGIHMAERFWPSPYEFHPERFMGDDTYKCKVQNAFFPFGYGPRICLGKQLAFNELIIALVKILQNFQVSQPKDAKEIELYRVTTLKARENPKVNIQIRT